MRTSAQVQVIKNQPPSATNNSYLLPQGKKESYYQGKENCRRGKWLMRKAANHTELTHVPPIVHEVLRSPGQPLDQDTRTIMEPRFCHDFSQVRVHTNSQAVRSAREIGARAYTVGQNIVFSEGKFAPEKSDGRKLLIHELTHVVQQSKGIPGSEQVLESQANAQENQINASYLKAPVQQNNYRGRVQLKPDLITSITVNLATSTVTISVDDGSTIIGEVTNINMEVGEYQARWDEATGGLEISPWPTREEIINFEVSGTPSFLRRYDRLRRAITSQIPFNVISQPQQPGQPEQQRTPPTVNPEVAHLSANLYVDMFESVHYSLDYRSEGGNLSTWLQVHYRDGTVIDINIYDISEESVEPRRATEMMANGHVGVGGRIFPERMNSLTTPRLYAAKRSAIETMEEYNYEFIVATIPAVLFIISMAFGGAGRPPRPVRRTVRLPGMRRTPLETPAGRPETPPAGGQATRTGSGVPRTGTAGSREASVRSAAERAARRPQPSPLPASQQVIRDTLIKEHPGLHTRVASEAARSGSRAMGPGGTGADVVLLNGGGREVSVHSGAFSSSSIGSHLQAEALQVNTTEIFLQINSSGASRQGLLQMISGLRSGYRELSGIFVKIFGPNGEVWWSGFFRGL